ncbi:hypothetical protein HMPREF9711_00913 [Myroides odoratimimus CCUG 3837]|uniref:glycosyltransferase family 2 protein n=1 Tax=Myroides odoratimimus TaxID=76832 RepID=UPI000280AC9D|nr:glycosyltransferase family 2 protein [Myroides odoratimimus]EKB05944.1 hypothetical protein HMPREF9711_00913 [Myroides odoratimimus CCUG 3837]
MISVVVPLYNKEESIQSTLLSVLNQTFLDFEIIVVNDGSTDSSVDKVLELNSSKIKLYSQSNAGVSAARNTGVRKASSSWIAFLDGDDLWCENHLEVINGMILNFPNESVFATSFVHSLDDVSIPDESCRVRIIENYYKEALKKQLLWTSVFVCRREELINTPFVEGMALGEDLYLFSRLIRRCKVVKSDVITAIYRLEAENRSTSYKYNISKSIISRLNFKEMNVPYEKDYFKIFLRQKAKDFLAAGNYKDLWFILKNFHFNLI